MSEYDERSLDDLTEEPTPHRLDELRKQGTVAQSRELTGTLVLLTVMASVYGFTRKFITDISNFMTTIFSKGVSAKFDASSWTDYTDVISQAALILAKFVLPVSGAAALIGVLGSLAQSGFIFSTEVLAPDFKRVNPISGLTRVFSLKSLYEGFKATLKFAIIGAAIYFAIESEFSILPSTVSFGPDQLMNYIGSVAIRAFSVVGALLMGAAAFDYWVQWRRFRKQAMMTKAEAKREAKEREGDPQIKARIRTVQRDMARKRMMKAIPKADVIVTNPTHIAVAIQYDSEFGVAPRVIAKGGDFLAERIKKIAREHGIPTVENKPLARTLYKHVKVGQMIPRSLYQAVAEILAYVYKLKGRRLGRNNNQPGI